jgi:hypothetical protein
VERFVDPDVQRVLAVLSGCARYMGVTRRVGLGREREGEEQTGERETRIRKCDELTPWS